MAYELAQAYVSLIPDTRSLAKGMTGARMQGIMADAGRTSGKSFGRSLGSFALKTSAGLAIGTKIASDVKAGIQDAISTGEAVNKVKVVFEDAADSVLAFADQGAKALGMSRLSALQAAGTFGNLLTATGLAEKQAAEMSTTMVQLSADMASFNDVNPQEVLDALRSGLSGETEPLKRFGVNLNEAILKQRALNMGLIESTRDVLPPAVRAQAAYAEIMEQTSKAQGDQARTADSAANRQKVVAAQWEDIRARLGQKLVPVIEKALGLVSGLLDKFSQPGGVLNLFPPETQEQLESLGGSLEELGQTVLPTVRRWYKEIIKPALDEIGSGFDSLGTEIIPTIETVVDWVRENWPVIEQVVEPVIANIVSILKGLAKVVSGIVGFVMALIRGDWKKAWNHAKRVFTGIVDTIKGVTGVAGMAKAFDRIKGKLAAVKQWFADLKTSIVNKVRSLVRWLDDKLDKARRILDKLNPFARHSPSLVDNVTRGARVIRERYATLSDLTIGRPAVALAAPSTGGSSAIPASPSVIVVADSRYTDMRKLKRDVQRVAAGDVSIGEVLGFLGM